MNANITLPVPVGSKRQRDPEEIVDLELVQPEKKMATSVPKIESLRDLIDFSNTLDPHIYYNRFNIDTLFKLVPCLMELDNMIGMEGLKKEVLNMVMYYLYELDKGNNNDMLHTAIYGKPGSGKSTVSHIIGKIYSKFGFLDEGKFKTVSTTDFIAQYLGQTEHKTKKLLEESIRGVMFMDEAYSISSGSKSGNANSYSKKALDVINAFLSEHKKDFVFIIAGYEEELNKCFFSVNRGLQRRFPWRFRIDQYSAKELREIFMKIVWDSNWLFADKIDNIAPISMFEDEKLWEHLGGDVEVFFSKIKICHTRRIFGMERHMRKKLTKADIDNGLTAFKLLKSKQASKEIEAHEFHDYNRFKQTTAKETITNEEHEAFEKYKAENKPSTNGMYM